MARGWGISVALLVCCWAPPRAAWGPSRRAVRSGSMILGRRPGLRFSQSNDPGGSTGEGSVSSTGSTQTGTSATTGTTGTAEAADGGSEVDPILLQVQKLRLEAERDELLLEKEKLTASLEAIKAMDRLVNKLVQADVLEDAYRNYKRKVTPELFKRMDERIAQAEDETSGQQLKTAFDGLLKLVDKDDEALAKKVRSAMNMTVKPQGNASTAVPSVVSIDVGDNNTDFISVLMKIVSDGDGSAEEKMDRLDELGKQLDSEQAGSFDVPMFVPQSLSSILRQKDAEDIRIPDGAITKLKEEVFKGSRFYVTGVEFQAATPTAALFRGNVKNGSNTELYGEILERFNAVPELSDNLRLFYQNFPLEPLQEMDSDDFFEEEPRPVFLVVNKAACPAPDGLGEVAFSFASLLSTMFTSLACGVGAFALNEDFVRRVSDGDTEVVSAVLPLWGGLIALQWLPELGHLLAAAAYGTRLSWPVMVPSLQLGSFGGITKFLSFPRNRQEMFDVSIAGPLVGFVTSFTVLVAGLDFTKAGPDGVLWPLLPTATFFSSALVGVVTGIMDPVLMQGGELDKAVAVHPLVVAGLTGLLVNALNFMPVGRLDGGRALTAVAGRRVAPLVGTVVLFLQGAAALFGFTSNVLLFWGILVVLFQNESEIAALDEVTEANDDGRATLYSVLLGLTILTLLPLGGLGGGGGGGLS